MSPVDAGHDPERFWALAVGEAERVAPALGEPDTFHRLSASRGVSVWWGDQATLVSSSRNEYCLALVQGRLDALGNSDDAAALLTAYMQHGIAIVNSLSGPFYAVVADAATDTLLCVRGPLGVQPLFYRERNGGLVFSPSPELLARCTREPPSPDRLALAEWVTRSTTAMERTFYAGVGRVPPGHALVSSSEGVRVSRYWEPAIGGLGAQLDDEEALDRFDTAFDRAVARIAGSGRCAVFLSGGLDSSLTAAALARHHQEHGLPPPLAVTLKFSDPNDDEEALAGVVARELGLSHLVVPLTEAAGGQGLLPAGIEASRRSWFPLLNPWNAAYERVAGTLPEQGLTAALRGEGGNDLLEPPWELAGDLMRRGRLRELLRFVDAQPSCYGGRRSDYVVPILWRRGLMALAKPVVHRLLLGTAANRVARMRLEHAAGVLQPWALPDPELRHEAILQQATLPPLLSSDALYAYARRKLLDNTYNTISLESAYLASRRSGITEPSPYWDADLYALVYSLPATSLYLGGHAKGLSHGSFARRVDVGLAARLGPSSAEATLSAAYAAEAGAAIGALRGFPRLAELGIVTADGARAAADPSSAAGVDYQAWSLLATEAWLQARGL